MSHPMLYKCPYLYMKTAKTTKKVAKAKAQANNPEMVIDLDAMDDAISDAVGTLLAVQSLIRMIAPEDEA